MQAEPYKYEGLYEALREGIFNNLNLEALYPQIHDLSPEDLFGLLTKKDKKNQDILSLAIHHKRLLFIKKLCSLVLRLNQEDMTCVLINILPVEHGIKLSEIAILLINSLDEKHWSKVLSERLFVVIHRLNQSEMQRLWPMIQAQDQETQIKFWKQTNSNGENWLMTGVRYSFPGGVEQNRRWIQLFDPRDQLEILMRINKDGKNSLFLAMEYQHIETIKILWDWTKTLGSVAIAQQIEIQKQMLPDLIRSANNTSIARVCKVFYTLYSLLQAIGPEHETEQREILTQVDNSGWNVLMVMACCKPEALEAKLTGISMCALLKQLSPRNKEIMRSSITPYFSSKLADLKTYSESRKLLLDALSSEAPVISHNTHTLFSNNDREGVSHTSNQHTLGPLPPNTRILLEGSIRRRKTSAP